MKALKSWRNKKNRFLFLSFPPTLWDYTRTSETFLRLSLQKSEKMSECAILLSKRSRQHLFVLLTVVLSLFTDLFELNSRAFLSVNKLKYHLSHDTSFFNSKISHLMISHSSCPLNLKFKTSKNLPFWAKSHLK